MTRKACTIALFASLVLLAHACGNGDEEDSPPTPITGTYVGQEIWISFGAEDDDESARRVGRTKGEAHALALALHGRVLSGEDIGKLAVEHSNAPGGAAAGFSSFLPRDRENPDARDRALASVPVGGVTPLLEWHRGWWFAKRVSPERGEELEVRFERLHDLRISIRVIALLYKGAWIADGLFEPKFTLEEAVRSVGELLARAKSGESFAELAKIYSEDASGKEGGLVRVRRPDGTFTKWLRVGEVTVPGKVMRAALVTPNGEIHPDVIVSPRGVFLVKVQARKQVEDD